MGQGSSKPKYSKIPEASRQRSVNANRTDFLQSPLRPGTQPQLQSPLPPGVSLPRNDKERNARIVALEAENTKLQARLITGLEEVTREVTRRNTGLLEQINAASEQTTKQILDLTRDFTTQLATVRDANAERDRQSCLRIAALEAQIQQQGALLDQRLLSMRERVSHDLEHGLSALDTRHAALKTTVDGHTASITSLEGRSTAAENKIRTLARISPNTPSHAEESVPAVTPLHPSQQPIQPIINPTHHPVGYAESEVTGAIGSGTAAKRTHRSPISFDFNGSDNFLSPAEKKLLENVAVEISEIRRNKGKALVDSSGKVTDNTVIILMNVLKQVFLDEKVMLGNISSSLTGLQPDMITRISNGVQGNRMFNWTSDNADILKRKALWFKSKVGFEIGKYLPGEFMEGFDAKHQQFTASSSSTSVLSSSLSSSSFGMFAPSLRVHSDSDLDTTAHTSMTSSLSSSSSLSS